ncbi:MAG: ABC transporter substrate-binding protein [Candidatus Omnitrophota bacterium]
MIAFSMYEDTPSLAEREIHYRFDEKQRFFDDDGISEWCKGVKMRKEKRAVIVGLFLVWVLMGVWCIKADAADVAVIVGEDYSIYPLVLKGFNDAYEGRTTEYWLHGDLNKGKNIIERIRFQSPRLIFALGSKAAQLAKLNISNIPIVFSMVVNPVRYGLVGDNICGVRLDVAPKYQLIHLKNIAPQVKRVGVIYDPQRTTEIIKEAKKEALALDLTIVDVKMESKSEISKTIKYLQDKIDAFWVIPDPVVVNSTVFQGLLFFSLSNEIPLLCPAKTFVKKGGLFSLDVDCQDLGRQAADIANKILSGEKTPADIGIQSPQTVNLVLNLKVAEKINLLIPQAIIDKAEIVE